MKVLIKFDDKVDLIDNVGVDDRCLPIVAGKQPYDSSSSPLMLESALWFKTIAVQAVYIDCNQRVIYWTSLESDISRQDVQVQTSPTTVPDTSDFIPALAKPLFKDHTIYDFDASLKEMMGKCCEMARKVSRKCLSREEYHKCIAKILHIYILPSITFTQKNDMFCLSRAKSLIDMHLSKTETDIRNKATLIQDIKDCLYKIEKRLLRTENMESENYLRTCKRAFLVALLKVVESKIDNLNLKLSSVQNMVNWVKEQPDRAHRLADLKKKRDRLFLDIDKRIQVREAIKNIIVRRQLTKRKVKKCTIVNSNIHNMFTHTVKMLEMEESSLLRLAGDKVNICAAREAVLFTMSELNNSDCATRFEPEKSADYSLSDSEMGVKKSEVWLTLQERVTKVVKDKSSVVSKYHEFGCKTLRSEIHHILSELQVAEDKPHRTNLLPASFEEDFASRQFSLSLDDAIAEEPKLNVEKYVHMNSSLINKEGETRVMGTLQPDRNKQNFQTQVVEQTQYNIDNANNLSAVEKEAFCTDNTTINSWEDTQCDFRISRDESRTEQKTANHVDDILADKLPDNQQADSDDNAAFSRNKSPVTTQQRVMRRQLTLSMWMSSVENLKGLIQSHFSQMIKCLDQHLHNDEDDTPPQEQQELLWKSYDRLFCQELHMPLLELYATGLTPGVRKAYVTLSKTPLHEILQEDKLLNLFYGHKIVNNRAASISVPYKRRTREKVREDQTFSALCLDVQNCNISDYNALADDDDDVFYECFDIEGTENVEECAKASSYDSATLSIDEGFDSASCSYSSSVPSAFTPGNIEEGILDNSEQWKILSSHGIVEDILYPILSPFRRRITKCLDAPCFLDKVRYITKAIERLNNDISQLIGPDHQSVCDDIISMLVLVLCNITEDMFVGLYVNLRLLIDVLPGFLSGSKCGYILVSLCASYDYLFTLKMCDNVVKQYPGIVNLT